MAKTKMKSTMNDKIFYFLNGLFLAILAVLIIYPLYFIIIASISDSDAVLAGRVVLYPIGINFDGFEKIIHRSDVWRGYLNTIIYTSLTVVISLTVTIPAGWALSRKNLPFKKFWMVYFLIPMFFGGGLIPFYNVMSKLGLINSIWAIVLPGCLSVWNLFMSKTFFESSIPDGLIEAATIDGAGKFKVFLVVVVPLAKAVIAVIKKDKITIDAGALNSYQEVFTAYERFKLTGTFSFSDNNGCFGLAFDFKKKSNDYKLISISPKDGKITLEFGNGSTIITEKDFRPEAGKEYNFTYIQEGSVGFFYIDGVTAFSVRLYGVSSKPVMLFAGNNTVTFSNLKEFTP